MFLFDEMQLKNTPITPTSAALRQPKQLDLNGGPPELNTTRILLMDAEFNASNPPTAAVEPLSSAE